MKGIFIVFEGIDGSGKTTQINLLRSNLVEMGYDVLLTREPGGTRISEIIRGILLNPSNHDLLPRTEAFLYAASRTQHVEEKIKPALSMGKIVLCDRFIDSTLVYQGFGRGQDLLFLQELNFLATNGLKPDFTILLDVPVEVGLSRRSYRLAADRLEQEDIYFHQRVRSGYLELSNSDSKYYVLDGSQKPEKISKQVLELVGEYL